MNPVPLAELRLRPRHHLSALWWLALMCHRPRVFQLDLEQLGRGQRFAAAVRVYLHALPYAVCRMWWFIVALGRVLVFDAFGIAYEDPPTDPHIGSWLHWHASGILVGLRAGIVVGSVFWIAAGFAIAIPAAITVGIVTGIPVGISVHIAVGLLFCLAIWFAVGIARGIAFEIGGGILAGCVFGMIWARAGIAGGIAVGIGSGIIVTRAYYLLGHPFFVWPRVRGDWYRRHPVAWDDLCGIPFPGLCRLLADYARFGGTTRPTGRASTRPSGARAGSSASIMRPRAGRTSCSSWRSGPSPW